MSLSRKRTLSPNRTRRDTRRDAPLPLRAYHAAPQKLRDELRALEYNKSVPPRKIASLLRKVEALADSHPGARWRLDEAREYRSIRALLRVWLRPAFRVGEMTSRGRVEHIGEYADHEGWLYAVRNERGVHDRVWEMTLVWPAVHERRRS